MTRPRLLPRLREGQYHSLVVIVQTFVTVYALDGSLNIYHVALTYMQVFWYNSFVRGADVRKQVHRMVRDGYLISAWQLQVAALSSAFSLSGQPPQGS